MAYPSKRKYIPAIASQSLGSAAHHSIESKLGACARHGFEAIEVFFEDLDTAAQNLPHSYSSPPGTSFLGSSEQDESLLAAASYVHILCTQLRLSIICLQPFMHYDGLRDRQSHASRLQDLQLWFHIADRLRTDLVQIPSNFLSSAQCTGDRAQIVADLREAADLGLQHTPRTIRFAYEALCWGTHIDTWDAAWDIVRAVDRPNFGTCLDTFNIAGRVYADPSRPSGKTKDAEADMARSLQKMKSEIDVSKIFYVEAVDAERLDDHPLTPDHPWHVDGQPPRMSWSRNARLFPFEAKAYLPILDVLRVICEDVGYQGYISFELFSRTLKDPRSSVPEEHARRGQLSWERLCRSMGWNEKSDDPVENAALDSKTQQGLQSSLPGQITAPSRAESARPHLSLCQSSISSRWQDGTKSLTPPVF